MNSTQKEWRSYLTGIGVLTGSLIVVLIFAELVFRASGKYETFNEKQGAPYHSLYDAGHKNWYHVYAPHQVTSQVLKEYSYSIMANNEGLLDRDFVISKKPRGIRILVIGDSFVQGMGAGTDSTCPKLMEGILKQKYGAGLDIEVWNCGIGNSDPFFEYKLLEDRLMKYNPDYVISVLNSTDISDVILHGTFSRFNPDSTVTYSAAPAVEKLYQRSFLVRRIMHDILGYNWMFIRYKNERQAELKSLGEIEGVLLRFKSLCAGHKIPYLVAVMPRDMEMQSPDGYLMQNLLSFCDSVHIPSTDIKPCLQGKGYSGEASRALYWPIDGHFNGDGYRRFAECLSIPLMPYLDSVAAARPDQ